MFKKLFSTLWLAVALAVSLSAQDRPFYDLIAQDHNRAGISSHAYEPSDTSVSPAPAGFTPFYVSHIGRHGSRTNNTKGAYKYLEDFKAQADAGNLTELGLQVYKELQAIADSTEGRVGQLTPRGALEHRQIAGRLVRHYPEIFSNPARNRVNSYDTKVKRVVNSRINFLSVVSAAYPSLDINIFGADKKNPDPSINERVRGASIPKELTGQADADKKSEGYKEAYDAAMKGLKRVSSSKIAPLVFVNMPSSSEASRFVHKIYSGLRMGRCVGVDTPACESLFDDQYCYYHWATSNIHWYYAQCNCPENTAKPRFNYIGKTILKHFIEDADEAVKSGSNVAADFRFSHDVIVLPFIAVVAPETCSFAGSIAEVNNHCFLPMLVCMGCNMQWIFYHNDKGQVLVKVLQNEKEVLIPGVKPFSGVYYKWSDLRKDLLKKCEIK